MDPTLKTSHKVCHVDAGIGDVVLAISICICQNELGPHSRLIAMELVGPREIRRRYGEMLLAGSGHLVNTTADCCSACLQYQPSGDHQEAVCNGEGEEGRGGMRSGGPAPSWRCTVQPLPPWLSCPRPPCAHGSLGVLRRHPSQLHASGVHALLSGSLWCVGAGCIQPPIAAAMWRLRSLRSAAACAMRGQSPSEAAACRATSESDKQQLCSPL